MNKPCIQADHLYFALEGPKTLTRLVDDCLGKLKPVKKTFEAFAYRGQSGALVAPILSVMLNKYLLCVRKPGEDSHSTREVEGLQTACNYVIVDDFVSSGDTAIKIQQAVYRMNPGSICVGLILYKRGEWVPRGHNPPDNIFQTPSDLWIEPPRAIPSSMEGWNSQPSQFPVMVIPKPTIADQIFGALSLPI